MTTRALFPIEDCTATGPPRTEYLPLDEGLWRAWVEKNEKQDKVRFARRIKVIAIIVVVLTSGAMAQTCMEESIAVWEGEGGSQARSAESGMTGTVNQIVWAVQIKRQADAEFGRVRRALELAASKQPAKDQSETDTMIRILEDKRAEVMAREEAGYFIHDWQKLRNQVSQMIVEDSRYKAIKSRPEAREQKSTWALMRR